MAVPLMLMRPCFFSSAVRNHRTVFRSVPVLSLFISSKSLATFSLRRIHPTANDSFSKLQGFFFKRFNVRATDVSDSGSIDSSMMQSMEKKIKEQLNADFVSVKDAYGDGRHVSIYVISSEFEGQSAVNRQRMVYKAIWEELQSTVHAVDQMVTRTPTEAEATNN